MTANDDDRTKPTPATRAEEARDARVRSGASLDDTASPVDDEQDPEVDDEQEPEVTPEVAEHYREMTDRGANQKGEAQLP